jgi:hypothetical protein
MTWHRALGYTLLSWLCCAYALAHYAAWTLPRTAWLHYTGQIPPPPLLPPWHPTLPIRLRERGWCTVCQRVLDEGVVRCSVHPEAEVMIIFRDEGTS